MEKYRAKELLKGLDELSIENLQCDPPRFTREAVRRIARNIESKWGIGLKDLGHHVLSEIRLADELSDLLEAARICKE